MKRKNIAVCTAVILTLSLLAGCGKNTETNSGAAAGASGTEAAQEDSSVGEAVIPEENTLPIVEPGSLELTYAGVDNWYTPASYSQNLEVWQEVEKRTGIKINWEVMPSDQYNAAMQTRIAAGSNLPDILAVPPLWNGDVVKYAEDGVILPLKDLIEKNAPNIMNMFEKYPITRKVLTAPDGEIYNLAEVFIEGNEVAPKSLIIRKDWLDKLNLEIPETIDDWYTVMKAFKEQDPNGNGIADEIPFTLNDGAAYNYLASGFGLTAGVGEFYADDAGKVQYLYSSPEYKELITFLHKLYSEGLIDPQYSTNGDEAKVDAMISKDIVGISVHFAGVDERWNKLVPGAEYVLVKPPVGPDGEQPKLVKRAPTGMQFALSKDCKDPAAAIRWIDYIWASDEGVILTHFGIEGKTFDYDENGRPKFTDWVTNNPEGPDAFSALRSLGAFPSLFDNQTKEFMSQSMTPGTLKACEELMPCIIEDFPNMLATADEADRLLFLQADMKTYTKEMIQKFIMGTESLDKYDAFLNQLDAMGLDEVLEIKQAQYDRYKQS